MDNYLVEIITFLLCVLFTIAISVGNGRKMTESPAGRPFLGAVGFLIVLAGYCIDAQDAALFFKLGMWFAIGLSPVWFGGSWMATLQRETDKAEAETDALNRVNLTGKAGHVVTE